MFSVGTFAPRSENTGERKVPEPFQHVVAGVRISNVGLSADKNKSVMGNLHFIHIFPFGNLVAMM